MKTQLTFLWLISCILLNASETIIIGKTSIALPNFEGFLDASKAAPKVEEYMVAQSPKDLKIEKCYVEITDGNVIVNKGQFGFQSYFSIGYNKTIVSFSIDKDMFCEIKKGIQKQFKEIFYNRENVKKLLGQIKKKNSELFQNVKKNALAPLGIFYEDENIMSAAMLATIEQSIDNKNVVLTQACSMNILHVKDNVLFFFFYKNVSDDNDVEWLNKKSIEFSKQIIALNSNERKKAIYSSGKNSSESSIKLMNEELFEYSTEGHPKAKGVEVTIMMPKTWEKKEGRRPNVVQLFNAPNKNDVKTSLIIMVKDFEALTASMVKSIDSSCVDESFLKQFMQLVQPEAKFIKGGLTMVDGEKTIWFESSIEMERAQIKMRMRTFNYVIMLDKKVVTVQCMVGGLQDNLKIDNVYEAYYPLFRKILASIVIKSKWNLK